MKRESAVRFFFKYAGYSYDPAKETKIQGRWKCAKSLAEAEQKGKEANLIFEWEYDDDIDVSWMDQEQLDELHAGLTEMLSCYCFQDKADCRMCDTYEDYRRRHNEKPASLASLGGTHIDVSDKYHYRRVVEAELALEALDELERQEDIRTLPATIVKHEQSRGVQFSPQCDGD